MATRFVQVKLYARTERPVQVVLLDVIHACGNDRLLSAQLQVDYIVRRLDTIEKSQATQRSVVALLLVELYCSRISMLLPENGASKVQEEFKDFLADHADDLTFKTAMNIMTSHGR